MRVVCCYESASSVFKKRQKRFQLGRIQLCAGISGRGVSITYSSPHPDTFSGLLLGVNFPQFITHPHLWTISSVFSSLLERLWEEEAAPPKTYKVAWMWVGIVSKKNCVSISEIATKGWPDQPGVAYMLSKSRGILVGRKESKMRCGGGRGRGAGDRMVISLLTCSSPSLPYNRDGQDGALFWGCHFFLPRFCLLVLIVSLLTISIYLYLLICLFGIRSW